MIIDYGCDYTQYTELFPHHCNALHFQASMKTFELLFSFFALKKISQVHQVHRNDPSSITFSQLWWNSSQLARLFKCSLVTWPEYSALIRLSASSKITRRLVGFSSKMWTWDALKVDNTGFFDKTCSGFRSRSMWRIMHHFYFKVTFIGFWKLTLHIRIIILIMMINNIFIL